MARRMMGERIASGGIALLRGWHTGGGWDERWGEEDEARGERGKVREVADGDYE